MALHQALPHGSSVLELCLIVTLVHSYHSLLVVARQFWDLEVHLVAIGGGGAADCYHYNQRHCNDRVMTSKVCADIAIEGSCPQLQP